MLDSEISQPDMENLQQVLPRLKQDPKYNQGESLKYEDIYADVREAIADSYNVGQEEEMKSSPETSALQNLRQSLIEGKVKVKKKPKVNVDPK